MPPNQPQHFVMIIFVIILHAILLYHTGLLTPPKAKSEEIITDKD